MKMLQHAIDFSNTLNASIAASWLILVVIGLRFLLRKAPKWLNVALWGIVALRLLMPFSIESAFSLIPSTQTVSEQVLTAEPSANHRPAHLDIVTNPAFGTPVTVTLDQSMDAFQWDMLELNVIWLAVMAVMAGYMLFSYLSLGKRLRTAVVLRENIFQSEMVQSPFVLGVIRPKIYLPYSLNDQDMDHVIAHEQAHIRRKDHWWKPLGFLLLTVHWFNPLMWLAYMLLCRDIELACDEKVIQGLGSEQRADYTQALLQCSISRPRIAACPLAFGEVGVKARVKSIMHYRKPGFWLVLTALILCLVVAVCFLTNPAGQNSTLEYRVTSYLRDGEQTEVLKAYNRESSSLDIAIEMESTAGPTAIELIFGYAKNGETEWVYSDPIAMGLGDSTKISVPADSHFTVTATYLEGQGGNVTFRFTERSHSGNNARGVIKWFDYTEDPAGMSYEKELKIQLDHFPDITFRYTPYEISAGTGWEDDSLAGKNILISGMPIWSAYFCDLTGDGLPEICAEASFGSGIIDNRVLIYDYAAGISYKLEDRGFHDYHLRMENDCLYVDKKHYNTDHLVSSGMLIFENGSIGIQQVRTETASVLLAEIVEIHDGYFLVAPVKGSWELNSASRIEVPMKNMRPSPEPQVGDILHIEYNGEILETYPAKLGEVYHIAVEQTNTYAAGMIPTDTRLEGFHAGALLVPIHGNIYRYSLTSPDPEGIRADELLFTFTETDIHRSIDWEIYSLKEYPDFTVVLAVSATNGTWLCTYHPPERCTEAALDNAIQAGCAVLEDGIATQGQTIWQDFFEQVRQGNGASVAVAHYYTLDPQRCSQAYYEVFAQDYPAMSLYQLAYDGSIYTLSRIEEDYTSVKTYAYLMVYDTTDFYAASSHAPLEHYEYVLTHDNMVTWEQLRNGLISSQADAYIDHFTVFVGEKPRTP